MTVVTTFTVTRDSDQTDETNALMNTTDTFALWDEFVADGKIISGSITETDDPNITNHRIEYLDSSAYQEYITALNDTPLKPGFTVSNYVKS
tara:strand:- start:586 stop:861 length:276 start_codon:yes stop_codon:yes gene_type:complete